MGIIKKMKQKFETQTTLLLKKAGIFKEKDIEIPSNKQKTEYSKLEEPTQERHSQWTEQI